MSGRAGRGPLSAVEDLRPPVTVRDPAVRAAPPDVLGEDEPVRGRGRRPVVPAVLAGLALLVVPVLGRAAQQERDERAQDRIAALALTDRFGFVEAVGAQVSSRASLVSLDLELRNDGPLPVRVDRAVVGDFRFLGDLDLEPGQRAVVPLLRTVTCPADGVAPPLDPLTEGLRLQVQTRAGLRSVLLSPGEQPLDRLRSAARRACR